MANQLYPFGKAHLLGRATKVDLVADTIKLLFYDASADVYDSANEFVAGLTAGEIIARSAALAGKTVTSGVFDADDVTLSAVTGDQFESVIIYKDTGSDATSPLIAWWDVTAFTPNGGDITVVFNASGLFGI